ncbi:MAG: EamA family transporter [bacterium]|nr:EamA family transporter [bacterium]
MSLDIAILFALGAAVSYACADMFARVGVERCDEFVGSMIALTGQMAMFIILVVAADVRFPPFGAHYFWVALGGAFNPGLFFIFFVIGIAKIGVARAAPIKGSSPILGALLAIIFLAERPAWYHLAGVILVVAGVALISSGKTEGRWRRSDAIWPLLAALVSGFAANFWRTGLQSFPDSMAANIVGVAAALALMAAYTLAFRRGQMAENIRRGWKPFLLFGLAAGAGVFFYAKALQIGEVYRMLPLIQTAPLFTVALALIFFRRKEHITWRVPAGALFTVGGALLVTLRLGLM